jgi:dolichol-phosphate mannosyltransferase
VTLEEGLPRTIAWQREAMAKAGLPVIHVVVPAFNEAGNIGAAIEGIRERVESLGLPHRIVVVDDGSTDDTAQICRALSEPARPVEVLAHPRNLGPGRRLPHRLPPRPARRGSLDVVLTLEGDTTSDPSVLLRMLHRVWEEGDHIVLASCYLYGGGIKGTRLHRVGISHVANGLMKKALGLSGLATLSSFYRLYQVSALQALSRRHGEAFLTSRGFECMVEILYRAPASACGSPRCPWSWTAAGGRAEQDACAADIARLPAAGRARPHRSPLGVNDRLRPEPAGCGRPRSGCLPAGSGRSRCRGCRCRA